MSNPALVQALRERQADVDEALQEISPVGMRLGLNELAPALGTEVRSDKTFDAVSLAPRLASYLKAAGLFEEFCAALAGGGSSVMTEDQLKALQISQEAGQKMFAGSVNALCAIFVGNQFQGSGCLVGPSLVLTGAHVVASAGSGPGAPPISVVLANRVRVGAEPTPVAFSPQAPKDTVYPFPTDDCDFGDCGDYALLRLRVPAGAGTATVPLQRAERKPTVNMPIMLLHYPRGERASGFGVGTLTSFDRPSVRWGYNTPARPGSSGGPCLDNEGELVGIHQGKVSRRKGSIRGRLVPISVIRPAIAAAVEADAAELGYTWSLDRRIDGSLVVGRQDLFAAFAKLAKPGAIARTLRIRRVDPQQNSAGLGYSVRLARSLIDRLAGRNHALVLSWPQIFYDDFDAIRHLAILAENAGLAPAGIDAEIPGARIGETGISTVLRGRTERLLGAIDRKAAETDEIIWLVIEHAPNNLGPQLLALETIANVAPQFGNLRTVLVGNEDVSLANPEVRVSDLAQFDSGPLPIAEFIGPFDAEVVSAFIDSLHNDLFQNAPLTAQMRLWSSNILRGIAPVNNRYLPETLPNITRRLRTMFGPMLVDGEVPAR